MHRVALIIVVVLGFLIAYQVVNPLSHTGLSFLGKRGSLLLAVVSLEVQVNCMRCILPAVWLDPRTEFAVSYALEINNLKKPTRMASKPSAVLIL